MRRAQTIKVKLEGDLYHDWGAIIKCCGNTRIFNKDDFEPGYMWHCTNCDKLLLVIASNGILYYAGKEVFDRKRR